MGLSDTSRESKRGNGDSQCNLGETCRGKIGKNVIILSGVLAFYKSYYLTS